MNLRTHYRLNRWTWLGAGVFSLFALIGIAGLVDGNGLGDKIFGAVLALVGAFFAIRQARAGVVIATSEGLIVRQLIRTYRVPSTQIERVTDEVRPRGPMAYRRCCLAVEFEDGTRKVYGDLNSAPSKRGRPATAAKVAAELDRLVAEQRSRGFANARRPGYSEKGSCVAPAATSHR